MRIRLRRPRLSVACIRVRTPYKYLFEALRFASVPPRALAPPRPRSCCVLAPCQPCSVLMGCGASTPAAPAGGGKGKAKDYKAESTPNRALVVLSWGGEESDAVRDEAVRIFRLADLDHNGNLDIDELKGILAPEMEQFAQTAMESMDLNLNGYDKTHGLLCTPCVG